MKKINVLVLGVLVLFAGFFGGCKKDSTDSATFDFIGSDPYISADKTVTAGSTIQFKWTISSPTSMASFDISKNDALVSGWGNKVIPSASKSTYTDEASLTADANPGTYVYTFTVYDSEGTEIIHKSITITVTASSAAITKYTAKLLGASASATGSSFSTSTGEVFGSAAAATNSAKVDFIYFYSTSASVLAEILSPSYGSVNYSSYVTANWGTKNSTKFAKTTAVTSSEFDAMTTDAKITSTVAGISWNTEERVVTLAVGDIFAFKTAAGKYGLAKVTALTTGEAGSITLSVNVQ
jgi:hypothetical protein